MKVVKFITNFTGYLVYKVFPMPSAIHRSRNKWLFASHIGWNGSSNAKSLFLQLQKSIAQEGMNVKAIWIAQSRSEAEIVRKAGFESYTWYSPKGLYHSLTAGIYLYTEHPADINRLTSRTAFCVALWHGIGVKKLYNIDSGYYHRLYGFKKEPSENSFLNRMKVPLKMYHRPDALLCTSRFQSETLFSHAWDIPTDRIILAGYPRNNMLLWPRPQIRTYMQRYGSSQDLAMLERLENSHFRKIYVYMPTWRNGRKESVLSMAGFDFGTLEEALAKTDSLFILKPHNGDLWTFDDTPHIIRFPAICDIYPILPFTDCLITDYSSIYSDYLLMGKEIILFPFDKDEYLADSCNLLDYDTCYLGKKVYSFGELVSLIDGNVDCHLSAQEQEKASLMYHECHGNGVDLIGEIRRRQEIFIKGNEK